MWKRLFVLLPICLGSLYWLYTRTIAQASLTWSGWGYSEWLINYQSGFVRRGLPGEIIHHFSNGHDALTGVNYFLFGVCGAVLILWTLLFLIQKKIPLWAGVVSFIMPGSLIHALAINQFFYRKEISFAIPLLMAAIGLVLWERRPQNFIAGFFIVFSALLGVVTTLFHETFVLAGLPALCLMWGRQWKALPTFFVAMPVIFAFAISCVYSGGAQTSQEIWDSLAKVDQERILSKSFTPRWPFVAERPRKAISVLASNAPAELLWVGVSFLESGFGLSILVLGSLILCLSAWLKVSGGEKIMESSRQRALWSMAVFLFICEFPIYLFSEDWGRWISWLGTAVLILWTSVWGTSDLSLLRLPRPLSRVVDILCGLPQWSSRAALVSLILWNFFFSIPEYGFGYNTKKNLFRSALFLVVDESRLVNFVNQVEREAF